MAVISARPSARPSPPLCTQRCLAAMQVDGDNIRVVQELPDRRWCQISGVALSGRYRSPPRSQSVNQMSFLPPLSYTITYETCSQWHASVLNILSDVNEVRSR